MLVLSREAVQTRPCRRAFYLGVATILWLATPTDSTLHAQRDEDARRRDQKLQEDVSFVQTMGSLIEDEIKRRGTPMVFEQKDALKRGLLSAVEPRARWLSRAIKQAGDSYAKAAALDDSDSKKWALMRDARSQAKKAQGLVEFFLGKDAQRVRPETAKGFERVRQSNQHYREALANVRKATDLYEEQGKVGSTRANAWRDKQKQMDAALEQVARSTDKAGQSKFRGEYDFWMSNWDANVAKYKRLSNELRAEMLPAFDPSRPEVLEEILKKYDQQIPSSEKPSAGGIFHDVNQREKQQAAELPQETYEQLLQRQRVEHEKTGGISGAGGISLHQAVQFAAPVDAKKVTRASVENDRLVLVYDGKKIRFPVLDLEHLALAMRAILDDKGVVRGTLIADEPNGIVVQTKKDEFGQVVWKKEYLPSRWKAVPKGERVALTLGPALGLSPIPVPSMNRVTYYGPIKNTRMGRVLLEADLLMTTLLYGVDPKTGQFVDPSPVKGFQTFLEQSARSKSKPAKQKPATKPAEDRGPWSGFTWFVWVPDEFRLQLDEAGTDFKFIEARMQMNAWSMNNAGLNPDYVSFARDVSQRYAQLAEWQPVLGELLEVAKAVSIVRWLEREQIPVDLKWARSYKVRKIDTPSTVQSYFILVDLYVDISSILKEKEEGEQP